MDYYTILAQRKLLSDDLTGRKVETVRMHGMYSVYIGLEGDRALKLAARPDMPYLHRTEKRFLPVRNARDWFPTKIAGTPLDSVDITHGDRIVTFRFGSGFSLVFEMTGRHANIVMIDPENIIAGAIRKVTGRQSGIREIKAGIGYTPPPSRKFPDLLWSPFGHLARAFGETGGNLSDVLSRTVTCGSLLFAHEAIARAGLDPDMPAQDISEDALFRLFKTAAELDSLAENGGTGGTIVYGDDGLPRDVFPLKMQSAGNTSKYIDDLDEAVRRYSLERERGLEKKQLRQSISASLKREEKSLRRTMAKIRRETGAGTEPEELERRGNTILANLHHVRKGMNSVTLTDPYDGKEIDIELDPTLDGPANAERIFARSRKLRSASRRAEERLSGIENRLAEIQDERARVDSLDDIPLLRERAAALDRKTSSGTAEADIDQPFPRRFTTVSGLEIIVGRNDRENDELVRWARKNDLWLHAQGVGGSHIILRTPGKKQQPDRRSVEHAASIAAYYSKAKTSAVVPVVCTPVKYVIKRKGQGPGQVTYTREKVIFAEPGLTVSQVK